MIIPVSEYLSFLVAMYQAGMERDVENAPLVQKGAVAARTIELTPTPKLYEVFGHIKNVTELTEALKNQRGGMVVDGTKPIVIGSQTRILGKYDTAVTPVLQRIVTAVDGYLKGQAWEITFTFEKPTTLIKCSMRGIVSSRPGTIITRPTGASGAAAEARDREFRGVTFGPTVKDCIEAAEGMLLDAIK